MSVARHALALVLELAVAASASAVAMAGPMAGMRGFTLADMEPDGSSVYRAEDFAALRANAANLVRVTIAVEPDRDGRGYVFPDAQMRYLDTLVEEGFRRGFAIVVALQPLPAGDRAEYWNRPALQAAIAELWQRIAARHRGQRAIAAFDLINEPVPTGAVGVVAANKAWRPFAIALTRAIRAADPERTVVVEPAPWGLPGGFAAFAPIPFENVVYSFHFYEPHELTHQGLPGYPYVRSKRYPGEGWDRARLSRSLDPVREFARRHGVPIYVGEFSCVRWASDGSAARYVADLLALFEAESWPWTYLGWRGYNGWDAELPPDAAKDLRPREAPPLRRADAPVAAVLRPFLDAKRGAKP